MEPSDIYREVFFHQCHYWVTTTWLRNEQKDRMQIWHRSLYSKQIALLEYKFTFLPIIFLFGNMYLFMELLLVQSGQASQKLIFSKSSSVLVICSIINTTVYVINRVLFMSYLYLDRV